MATVKRYQSTMSKVAQCHKSKLLTREENYIIHSLIDKNGVSLVTTVVELYLTEAPSHNNWIKEGTGVLCLVQNMINEYAFHLYSLEREDIMWWCPLYKNCSYRSEISFFHMFYGQNCVVGFNFANEAEAKIIGEVVKNYIQKPEIDSKFIVEKPRKTPTLSRKVKKKSNTFIISQPTNFQHIAHLSFDKKSFNNNTENQLLSEIFKRAGITESQLSDRKTMEFMVKFVQKKQSRKKYRAPPPPQMQPPASRLNQEPSKCVPTRPPPVPPVQRQLSFKNNQAVLTTPPTPPPLPVINREIREQEMVSSFIIPESSVPDSRSALLDSIRKGSTLKSVKQREIRRVDDEELFKNDIATALSRAIRLREKALQNNDSFSESDGDSDDWEDFI